MSVESFDRHVNAAHRGKGAAELADLGVDALKGVSAADRERLHESLDIATIGDLGRNRFARIARAIVEDSVSLPHDRGPDDEWTERFADAPLATYEAHPSEFRLDFEPERGVEPDDGHFGIDFTDADHVPIPRFDLPFGMPVWHGIGSHARRERLPGGSTDDKAILWRAPPP